jgi:hypothetical protein
MFQIKKYLQYKNTPDGKPRVLTEGVDYNFQNDCCLFQQEGSETTFVTMAFNVSFYKVANLQDCRPLFSVEMDGVDWTEGEISVDNPDYITEYTTFFANDKTVYGWGFTLYTRKYDFEAGFDAYAGLTHDLHITGSFFDDPAKYSKLLWNCSEKKGWEKVLKLLNINV